MEKEMTRYAFIEHMKDYMKELLNNPLKADTDEFLHAYGIDAPTALEMLLKKSDPNDEYSSIIIRKEYIKDNGYDENNKKLKDTFTISYKIPRKNFDKKLRNLYINLFEQNITNENFNLNDNKINEGAWGYDILDNDTALDEQDKFAKISLRVLISKINNSKTADDLWANTGVLIDFLKKYKEDEIHFNDNYNFAINIAKNALAKLYENESFISSWDEPKKMKSTLKKLAKEVGLLHYQKEIMNPSQQQQITAPLAQPMGQINVTNNQPINEDGESGVSGATSADSSGQFSTPLFGKPIKRNLYITKEQMEYIKEATTTTNTGNYQYDVPMGDDGDFYKDALNHKNLFKNNKKNEL